MAVTSGQSSVGLAAALKQYDVVLPPLLIMRDSVRCVDGFTIMPQQQSQSQIPSPASNNYVMGPQMSFPFQG